MIKQECLPLFKVILDAKKSHFFKKCLRRSILCHSHDHISVPRKGDGFEFHFMLTLIMAKMKNLSTFQMLFSKRD